MIKRMICIAVCAWMCASCEKNDGGGYTKYHLRQQCGMMRQNAPHICHTFVNCRIYDINREMHEAAR